MANWIAVCQWCGKRGGTTSTRDDGVPRISPSVPGKCTSHPAGPNMPHGPRWEKC